MVLLFLIVQLFFLYLPTSFNFYAHCGLLYPSYPLWLFMPLWNNCSFSKDMWVEYMSEIIFSLSLPLNNYLWEWDCRLSVTFPQDFEDVYFIVLWNLWLQIRCLLAHNFLVGNLSLELGSFWNFFFFKFN